MATTKKETTKKTAPKKEEVARKAPANKAKKATSKTKAKTTAKTTKANESPKKDVSVNKFAVIEVNSAQLMVHEGGKYEIDRIEGEKGDKMTVEEVLLIADGSKVSIGKPYVKGAKVEVVIDSQKRGKKMRVFKYKAKSRYRRSYGHRDEITRLEVKSIKG